MSGYSNLRVFISSRMEELADERETVSSALQELNIQPWKFESSAGARPQTIRETFLEELEAADLYLGLFWKGFGQFTIDEFREAQKLGIPCFVYEKRTQLHDREARLQDFLDELGSVESGVTIQWFQTPDELKEFVKRDISGWQASLSRKGKEASVKEIKNEQRKQFRKRVFLLVGALTSLALILWSIFNYWNGQLCVSDQPITQYGAVHIFEGHMDGDDIRWWAERPKSGFFSFTSTSKEDFPKEVLGAEIILSIEYDPIRDFVWVGTSGKGLIRLAKKGGKWTVDKKFNLFSGLTSCRVQSIFVANDKIYVGPNGSTKATLSISKNGNDWEPSLELINEKLEGRLFQVASLAKDSQGSIWVGTSLGLYRYDDTSWYGSYEPDWIQIRNRNYLNINKIAVDDADRKWIGTNYDGLVIFDDHGENQQWFQTETNTDFQSIYSIEILPSSQKALIGTNTGLYACEMISIIEKVRCNRINDERLVGKPVYSLVISPDGLLAKIGTDNPEFITISSEFWE